MPRRRNPSKATLKVAGLPGAKPAPFLGFIEPCLAQVAETPPTTKAWVHEVKVDGYRIQAHVNNVVKLYTRKGLDWTTKFRRIVKALTSLLPHQIVLDGEAAVLRAGGSSNFGALQEEIKNPNSARISYVVFDVLYFDGFDLRDVQFIDRQRVLANVCLAIDHDRVQINPYTEEDGIAVFEAACAQHLEGIVSKRKDSLYRSGRQGSWLKSKCRLSETFPVVGFTETRGSKPRRIASLHIGRWEGKRLLYGGKVGTGFSDQVAHTLRETLNILIRPTSPLSSEVPKPKPVWVEPLLLIEVEYSEITAAGVLRGASF